MKRCILFDFDGVIGDTFSIAVEVFNLSFPPMTADDVRQAFDTNINLWIDSRKKSGLWDKNIDFASEYSKAMANATVIFPGMKEVLTQLSASYILIIVSSNKELNISRFLSLYGLNDLFADTIGVDAHPLKTEKIKRVFVKYDTAADHCVFVTDTSGDMMEAAEAGVRSIGVSWGFHSPDYLKKGNPFCIISSPKELPEAVERYFKHP